MSTCTVPRCWSHPSPTRARTSRPVYLPAGTDWYNYWTNEKLHGGQTIQADAPIDLIPLFVRAGSILPLGEPLENTQQRQAIEKVRIYPGADGGFALYEDDGSTYAYEKSGGQVTNLHWTTRNSISVTQAPMPGADLRVV